MNLILYYLAVASITAFIFEIVENSHSEDAPIFHAILGLLWPLVVCILIFGLLTNKENEVNNG